MPVQIKVSVRDTKRFQRLMISSLATLLVVPALAVSVARAATSADVSATVTVQNISVSASDGSISYGTLGSSSTEDTTSGGVNDTQTATNNGNVTEDLDIRGSNSADWTLAATAGADQYTHKYCTTDCDTTPTWNALTTSYQTLSASVSASGTQTFDLQVGTPTSSSSFAEQSVDVTVLASAS